MKSNLLEHYESDPNTKVIACYLEGIKEPERFRHTLETITKPLVMLKSGRTPRGRIAAESHTKSLAGADAIYSSLLERYGICRAQTFEELYDFSKAFAYLKPPSGNRLVFVTTSGGAAILATDAAETRGPRHRTASPRIVGFARRGRPGPRNTLEPARPHRGRHLKDVQRSDRHGSPPFRHGWSYLRRSRSRMPPSR